MNRTQKQSNLNSYKMQKKSTTIMKSTLQNKQKFKRLQMKTLK